MYQVSLSHGSNQPYEVSFPNGVSGQAIIQRYRLSLNQLFLFVSAIGEVGAMAACLADGVNIEVIDEKIRPYGPSVYGIAYAYFNSIRPGHGYSGVAGDGNSALHLSCIFGQEAACRFLLQKRPSLIHIRNQGGATPLFELVQSPLASNIPFFTSFLEAGAELDVADTDGDVPMRHIAKHKEPHLLFTTLTVINQIRMQIFIEGVPRELLAIIRDYTISASYIVNFTSPGPTNNLGGPLLAAVKWKRTEAITLLMQAGADPNASHETRGTPLAIARESFPEAVPLLKNEFPKRKNVALFQPK